MLSEHRRTPRAQGQALGELARRLLRCSRASPPGQLEPYTYDGGLLTKGFLSCLPQQ